MTTFIILSGIGIMACLVLDPQETPWYENIHLLARGLPKEWGEL